MNNIKESVVEQKTIEFDFSNVKIGDITKEIVSKKNRKEEKSRSKKEKDTFYKKLKKAGVNDTKISEIIILINERNLALKTIKEAKKNEESLFSITETNSSKTPKIIKTEFAQKLVKILDYKTFSVVVGDDFRKKSTNQAKSELKTLVGDKELKEEQFKELLKLVYGYYFNQNITKAYYSHDKQLLKQKLGVLTYRFEKKYLELAKELGIDVGGRKKIDNRTFQWN